MKRLGVLFALAAAIPARAIPQVPIAPSAAPAGSPAAPPPTGNGNPAPSTPPPGAPAPAPATPDAPSPAPADPAPADAIPAGQPGSSQAGPPQPGNVPPGDQYYVDAAPPPAPFEPPPPMGAPFEPPPPPQRHHVAPTSSLWLGARAGWFFPFGNVWARGIPAASDRGHLYYVLEGEPWRDYATSGPLLELDIGLRLSRSYNVFLLWERGQTRAGNYESGPDGEQSHGDTDFWALGLRANSNPDRLGFVTEVAIGFRRARTIFENDVEYQFTDAPFEARLGLGAEYRLSRGFAFSALGTVGVGAFGSADRVTPGGAASSLTSVYDEGDGHAWATLQVGGHFDLLSSRN